MVNSVNGILSEAELVINNESHDELRAPVANLSRSI